MNSSGIEIFQRSNRENGTKMKVAKKWKNEQKNNYIQLNLRLQNTESELVVHVACHRLKIWQQIGRKNEEIHQKQRATTTA